MLDGNNALFCIVSEVVVASRCVVEFPTVRFNQFDNLLTATHIFLLLCVVNLWGYYNSVKN